MATTTRYPVQYACGHCGQHGFTKKDAKPGYAGRCPSCLWGTPVKMRWNGFRWV